MSYSYNNKVLHIYREYSRRLSRYCV